MDTGLIAIAHIILYLTTSFFSSAALLISSILFCMKALNHTLYTRVPEMTVNRLPQMF